MEFSKGLHPLGVSPLPPRAPTRDAPTMVRIGSRGVFVPVSRHPLWVPIGINLSGGPRGQAPWRGLGCPQILPFFSFAAGGGRRKGVQRASLCWGEGGNPPMDGDPSRIYG